MNLPGGALLLFYPLLLERSYGGGGELVAFLLQGLCWLVGLAVVGIVLAKLGGRAEEAYGASYHKFLKRVGIIAALFAVVYALASIGSH